MISTETKSQIESAMSDTTYTQAFVIFFGMVGQDVHSELVTEWNHGELVTALTAQLGRHTDLRLAVEEALAYVKMRERINQPSQN